MIRSLPLLLFVLLSSSVALAEPCEPDVREAEHWIETSGCMERPWHTGGDPKDTFQLFWTRSRPTGKTWGRILFFHGGPGFPARRLPTRGALWTALRAHFDVIYFHQRGTGWSARLVWADIARRRDFKRFSMDNTVSDALALADWAWGTDASLIPFGKSAGGFLALKFAVQHPQRVERLLLAATSAHHGYASGRDRVKKRFFEELALRFPGFEEELRRAKRRFPDGPIVEQDDGPKPMSWAEVEDRILFDLTYSLALQYEAVAIVRQLARGRTSLLKQRVDDGAVVLRMNELTSEVLFLAVACRELGWRQQQAAGCLPFGLEEALYDVRSRLASLEMPVLVLAGGHDPVLPKRYQEEIVSGLPADSVSYKLFRHSGHMIFVEQSRLAVRIILDFLQIPRQQPAQDLAP